MGHPLGVPAGVSATSQGLSSTSPTLARHRQELILTDIRQRGAVRVSELVARLGVSDMTIRRDLDVLAAAGHLAKVHGGATAIGSRSADEPGFEAKSHRQQPEKLAIASAGSLSGPPRHRHRAHRRHDHVAARLPDRPHSRPHRGHELGTGRRGAPSDPRQERRGDLDRRRADTIRCLGRTGRGCLHPVLAPRSGLHGGSRHERASRVHDPEPDGSRDEPRVRGGSRPSRRARRSHQVGHPRAEHHRIAQGCRRARDRFPPQRRCRIDRRVPGRRTRRSPTRPMSAVCTTRNA